MLNFLSINDIVRLMLCHHSLGEFFYLSLGDSWAYVVWFLFIQSCMDKLDSCLWLLFKADATFKTYWLSISIFVNLMILVSFCNNYSFTKYLLIVSGSVVLWLCSNCSIEQSSNIRFVRNFFLSNLIYLWSIYLLKKYASDNWIQI